MADDDATSRLIAQTALRSLGHECQTVERRHPGLGSLPSPPTRRRHQRLDDARADRARTVPQHPRPPNRQLHLLHHGHQPGRPRRDPRRHDRRCRRLSASNRSTPTTSRPASIAAARVTSLHHQLAQQRTELEASERRAQAIARRDPLTGLGNRRALQEDLELLEARVARYGHRYCMALLDVDHFKSYNDTTATRPGTKSSRPSRPR